MLSLSDNSYPHLCLRGLRDWSPGVDEKETDGPLRTNLYIPCFGSKDHVPDLARYTITNSIYVTNNDFSDRCTTPSLIIYSRDPRPGIHAWYKRQPIPESHLSISHFPSFHFSCIFFTPPPTYPSTFNMRMPEIIWESVSLSALRPDICIPNIWSYAFVVPLRW